jgi:hypothetical protein
MAQQTINVGAAPNDGTGTPLRTAFQYTNSNFSELYTAVGPSGNNIVVPGSATITGDLVVDTSTLKVDSANNRVGIGTASPATALNVVAGGINTTFDTPSAQDARVEFKNNGTRAGYVYWDTSEVRLFADSGRALTFYQSGTLGMTLNSTGLGVGASPTSLLHISGASPLFNIQSNSSTVATTASLVFTMSTLSTAKGAEIIAERTGASAASALRFHTNDTGGISTERLRIDSSGNVGIGVTPSAWTGGSYIQLPSSRAFAFAGAVGDYISNGYYDGSWRYTTTAAVTRYRQDSGIHLWYNAPSGTANGLITFGGANMTLDASGNLLVGVTSTLINTTRRLSVSGVVAAALQSTGAATVETINVWHTATSGNNVFVDFDTEASVTSRGSISYNRAGGLVAYNTTSDYRAKDIIGPVSNSGSLIDSLKVYVGKMKGATIERPMLIAHEAQEVAPYSVTGVKDEVDADGKDKYQQMDVSSFVPLLIAEIQSLRARVQTLEAK